MFTRNLILCSAAVVLLNTNAAPVSFTLLADSAGVWLWQSSTQAWNKVTQQTEVRLGDSVAVENFAKATIIIEEGSYVSIKDNCRVSLEGQESKVVLSFTQGQLLLKRVKPSSFDELSIIMNGCKLLPLGTVAAMKYTASAEPTVAVIEGQMKFESPTGSSTLVEAGTFCTYDRQNGVFKHGELKTEAIAALQKWAESITITTSQLQPNQFMQPQYGQQEQRPQKTPAITTQTADIVPTQQPQESATVSEEQPSEQITKKSSADQSKPTFEISASNVTVDGKQWTRIAFAPDIPIWKFGICLDLEVFLNEKGEFSDKGWSSKNWEETIIRKIRYLRFGQQSEKLFIKIGGLSEVTLGYGFIMDRFTNMLYYPNKKYMGVQFYLNDISPLGITMQAVTPSIMEFAEKDGLFGVRFGLKPLKPLGIPIVQNIRVCGSYVCDMNQYAPAKQWKLGEKFRDKDEDGLTDADYAYSQAVTSSDSNAIEILSGKIIDASYPLADTTYRDSTDPFSIVGGDIDVALISNSLLSLGIYAQAAMRSDNRSTQGWGFGAPGVRLSIWKLAFQAEYRHIKGKFTPGYFGPYYEDERLVRYPEVATKEKRLAGISLDGVFASAELNIINMLLLNGKYQFMTGKHEALDHRYESCIRLGDFLLEKIPKLTKVEAYLYKTNVGRTIMKNNKYDSFAQATPSLYVGYRVGVEIAAGASLLWDMRYGWLFDENKDLKPNNTMSVQTAVSF